MLWKRFDCDPRSRPDAAQRPPSLVGASFFCPVPGTRARPLAEQPSTFGRLNLRAEVPARCTDAMAPVAPVARDGLFAEPCSDRPGPRTLGALLSRTGPAKLLPREGLGRSDPEAQAHHARRTG